MITANKKQLILLIAQMRYKKMQEAYMQEYLGNRAEAQENGEIHGQERGYVGEHSPVVRDGGGLPSPDRGEPGNNIP